MHLLLRPGAVFVEGVESPYSLMAASKGVYGEAAGEWTPADALGFSKIVALPGMFHARAGEPGARTDMVSGMRSSRGRQDRLGHRRPAACRTSCASPTEIPAEEGVVVVVEVLNNKSTYNTLELTSGRMAKVGKGDIVVGRARASQGAVRLLGPRAADARSPATSSRCSTSAACSASATPPTPTRASPSTAACSAWCCSFPYLGERIGVPARVGYKALDFDAPLDARGVPVVALAGTCMEAGKTAAACAIIARMRHRGLTVDAFKATGVSLRRDILAIRGRRRAPHA